ncbi:hypothetical protein OTC26_000115 [Streptomyces tirandamycinicus]|uniref:hypothetical protein n=1 Tax=Streptomyces tirandamycinicus TaxID=2174846 RepID=UPI00227018B4|nr:hypothetical protein [Streptomyces tirandamycinicus]MCY0982129.1 hypothetical protein [Streptomyces tirandamycinicus]
MGRNHDDEAARAAEIRQQEAEERRFQEEQEAEAKRLQEESDRLKFIAGVAEADLHGLNPDR